MPVTDQQARALAFLAVAARPSNCKRWDEAGVLANITKVADRSLSSVVIAVIQACEDRNAATPGVIPTNGPHWRTPEAGNTTQRTEYDATATCATCGMAETTCRSRWRGDHDFESVAGARGHKRDSESVRLIVEAIKGEIVATKPPPPKRTLDDLMPAQRDPRVEAARAALRAGRPELSASPVHPTPERTEAP